MDCRLLKGAESLEEILDDIFGAVVGMVRPPLRAKRLKDG